MLCFKCYVKNHSNLGELLLDTLQDVAVIGHICKPDLLFGLFLLRLVLVGSIPSVCLDQTRLDLVLAFDESLLTAFHIEEVDLFLEFPVQPTTHADCLIVDVINAMARYLAVHELTDVLAAVLEEEVSLAAFLEIFDFPVVDFSIGVLYLALVD